MRDLDQTVIGNPAHDLVRLALSLAMAARSSDLPGVTTARMTEDLVAGYERAFEGERAVRGDRRPAAADPARHEARGQAHLEAPVRRAARRATRGKIPLGRRFWRLADDERDGDRASSSSSSRSASWSTKLEERDAEDAESRSSTPRSGSRAAARSACGAPPCSSSSARRAKKGEARRVARAARHQASGRAGRAVGRGRRSGPRAGRARARRCAAARAGARRAHGRGDAARSLGVRARAVAAGSQGRARSSSTPSDARAVAYYLGMVVGRAHRRQLDATSDARVDRGDGGAPHEEPRCAELAVAGADRARRAARARVPRALPARTRWRRIAWSPSRRESEDLR